MKTLFDRLMNNAAYVLFLVGLATFVFSLLSGFEMRGLNFMLVFTTALQTSAVWFVVSALVFRIDRWLETKK